MHETKSSRVGRGSEKGTHGHGHGHGEEGFGSQEWVGGIDDRRKRADGMQPMMGQTDGPEGGFGGGGSGIERVKAQAWMG